MNLLVIWTLILSVFAKIKSDTVPDLNDAASVTFVHDFPKNELGTFPIDQKGLIRINMTNDSPLQKTIFQLTGYYTDPNDVSKNVRKITTEPMKRVVKPGKTVAFKYRFNPLVESGAVGLLVIVDYYDKDDEAYKSIGAADTIQLVYSDTMYDFQSISIYVLVAGMGVLVYYSFGSKADGIKTTKRSSKKPIEPIEKPTEADLSWIPDHVIKAAAKAASPKVTKKKK